MSEAEIDRIADGFYRHAGLLGAEITRLGRWSPEQVLEATEVVGIEHAERALDEGRGLIAVSGHLGNWELGLAALGVEALNRRGMRVRVVVEGQRHGPVREYLHAARSRFAVPVAQDAAADCFACLREGHALILMCDQWVRFGGIEVPFFGRPVLSHAGAAMLHRLTRAPVLFGADRRLPERLKNGGFRHRITIEPPMELARTRDREADLRENTARIQQRLERAVRDCPEQWTWTHRRWGEGQVEYRGRGEAPGG
jgi:Kdo2-lipid IVA lauroyltransferase/acyltransferase